MNNLAEPSVVSFTLSLFLSICLCVLFVLALGSPLKKIRNFVLVLGSPLKRIRNSSWKKKLDKQSPTMEVDWSFLPKEILDNIIKRLPIADQIRFGAVNKVWASVAAECRHPPSPELPWIWMTPPRHSHYHPGAGDFYSPSDKRVYKLNMPKEALAGYCCGSHEGWLIMTDDSVNNLFFVNPLIPNAKYTAQLPDEVVEYYPYSYPLVILSSLPTDPQCIVLVLHFIGQWVSRPFMGEGWSSLPIEKCSDLIIHDGSIYAATIPGELFHIELSGSNFLTVETALPPALDDRLFKSHQYHMCWRLVESCKGELLMVFYFDDKDEFPMAVRQVFKANLGKGKWEKLRTLGDQMLLLSESSSMSMKASDLPGFQENCVYSVHDHCIHMLDVKKKKIEMNVDESLDLFLFPRIFWTPSLR